MPSTKTLKTVQRRGVAMVSIEEANLHGSRALVSLVPHTVTTEPGGDGKGEVAEFTPELSDADVLVMAKPAAAEEESSGVSLADAKVIVSGGRGVGSAEGFAPLEELAELEGIVALRRGGLAGRRSIGYP